MAGGATSLVRIGELEDYHAALFLTVKNYRKFCELREDDQGRLLIEVKEVQSGNSAVDFNFLLLHKITGRGIYQYHHQSCAFGKFSKFCREQYEQMRQDRITDAINRLGLRPKKSAIKHARSNYRGGLRATTLISGANAIELLSELSRIRQLEFTVEQLAVEEPWATPLGDVAKTFTRRVTFNKGPIQELRNKVSEAIRRGDMHNGRIRGDDEDGIGRIIQLSDNADIFGEYEFNEIAGQMAFDLDNVSSAPFLAVMLDKAREHAGYFETQAA